MPIRPRSARRRLLLLVALLVVVPGCAALGELLGVAAPAAGAALSAYERARQVAPELPEEDPRLTALILAYQRHDDCETAKATAKEPDEMAQALLALSESSKALAQAIATARGIELPGKGPAAASADAGTAAAADGGGVAGAP
jgi:hypothetical protein